MDSKLCFHSVFTVTNFAGSKRELLPPVSALVETGIAFGEGEAREFVFLGEVNVKVRQTKHLR